MIKNRSQSLINSKIKKYNHVKTVKNVSNNTCIYSIFHELSVYFSNNIRTSHVLSQGDNSQQLESQGIVNKSMRDQGGH